jgi:MFS transporter, DHA1 family, multidrug resistance protein
MSQVTIFFGVAPAVAPLIGGWLFVHADWHAIFWLLAVLGARCGWQLALAAGVAAWSAGASPSGGHLLRGYWQIGRKPALLALVLASGVPFNGMFLYVLAAPAFLGEHLRLAPTQFFWFFVLSIGGIMGGAWLWAAGRAHQAAAKHQIRHGFVIMAAVSWSTWR